MKNIYFKIYLLMIVLFILSCDTKDMDNQFLGSSQSSVLLKFDKTLFNDINEKRKNNISSMDDFVINYAKREGDVLNFNVSYSGGCATHQFEIIWDGIIYTDDPCFINLLIVHNGNMDNCEAYLTENISIKLEKLIGNAINNYNCGFKLYSTFNKKDTPDVSINIGN